MLLRALQLLLNTQEHALWVELFCLNDLAKVGPFLALLEVGKAKRQLDDLVEILIAADARAEEDGLRHARQVFVTQICEEV